jgi:ketosteroid isomerase-like protein
MRRCIAGILLAVALTACAATDSVPSANDAILAAAREQVNQRMNDYGVALRAGDVAGVLSFWAPDVRVQEPGQESGSTELTQRAQEFFPANQIAAFAATTSEMGAHDGGAVVYQWGNYTESIQPKDSSVTPTMRHSNFVARWVKNERGEWRIHRLTSVAMPRKPSTQATAAKSADAPIGSMDDRLAAMQIEERTAEWASALRANQSEAIVAFWTEDAQHLESEVHVVGKPALTVMVADLLATQRITQAEMVSREIFVHDHGTIAYQYGSIVQTTEPKNNGTPASTTHCNFLARWRRGSDGLWRVDAYMSIPQPAKSNAPAPSS